MATPKEKLLVTDSEGRQYEVLKLDEWRERSKAQDAPQLMRAVTAWMGSNAYGTTDLYYNEAVLMAISQTYKSDPHRWAVLQAFRPPMAGLKLSDFMDWATAKIATETSRNQSHYGNSKYAPRLAPYDRNDAGWREEVVSGRSKFPQSQKTYRWNAGSSWAWGDALTRTWVPNRVAQRGKYDYAQELILLNEFIGGDGKSFEGTFGEYLDLPHTADTEAKLTKYILADHGNRADLLTYMGSGKVAQFRPSAQLRTRKLLLEQDRATWRYIVKAAPEYNKGKSHEHLQKLLEDFLVAKGEEQLDFRTYSEAELRREYTLLVAESILFEGPYYSPAKLHGLASVALKAVPSERELTRFKKEYSHILHLLREQQTKEQSNSELMAMLAEDSDQDEVKAAAAQAGKLTLMQLTGVLMATFHPRSWIRGLADNGPYVLVDLIQAEGLREVAQLLGDIVLTSTEEVPTETEWRKAIGVIPMASSGFFLPLVVSPRAMGKGKRRGFPEVVGEARGFFGSDRS